MTTWPVKSEKSEKWNYLRYITNSKLLSYILYDFRSKPIKKLIYLVIKGLSAFSLSQIYNFSKTLETIWQPSKNVWISLQSTCYNKHQFYHFACKMWQARLTSSFTNVLYPLSFSLISREKPSQIHVNVSGVCWTFWT